MPFPLLCDTRGEVCGVYGACDGGAGRRVRRNTYIIGPDGAIIRVFEDVDPAEQAELVLRFLRGERMAESMDGGHDHHGEAVVPGPPEDMRTPPSVLPPGLDVLPQAHVHGPPSILVFALGSIGYDLVSEARRDSIMQHMSGDPGDSRQLLDYLDENPTQAVAVTWTLNLDTTPIYAIQPDPAFAAEVYGRLRQFLREQLGEGVERVSVPGMLSGEVRLMSGQLVPVIRPELRCMYSWTTPALVRAVVGEPPKQSAKDDDRTAYAERTAAIVGFFERVYHELRNLGVSPQDRAVNYAATNALNVERIFERALREQMELDEIAVELSPLCRPGSECWDVKLTFFNPSRMFEQARRVHRFTIDVSDVCPVMVGKVRSWSVR